MNYFTILITLLILLCRLLPAETQKLPPIDSLKELPVEIAADFLDHDDIASPAMPVIAKDGTMFFYDAKLKQVFKTHLDKHKLVRLSKQGEGSKKYIDIRDMLIDGEYVYMIDSKQKLLCFGIDGKYKWEIRTDIQYDNILAKNGDTFFLVGTSYDSSDFLFKRLFKWRKGQKRLLVTQLPQLYYELMGRNPRTGKRSILLSLYLFAEPVFCVCKKKDMIITAADNQYRFNLLNTNGSKIKTISIHAPAPDQNKFQKRHIEYLNDKPYAIFDIFCEPPYIVIISNYFKEDKPRIDFFSMEGIIKRSFLMPGKMNPESFISTWRMEGIQKRSPLITVVKHLGTYISPRRGQMAKIANGFLLYSDLDKKGFKVYKIKPASIH
jgi:hypothetical protein